MDLAPPPSEPCRRISRTRLSSRWFTRSGIDEDNIPKRRGCSEDSTLACGNKNNWVKLKLIGTKCNRTAVGARARVVTGDRSQIDEVHTGTSVMSQSDLRLHFGVGQNLKIDLIEVKWPTTQQIEKFTNVDVNQILTIKEGFGITKAEKIPSPGAAQIASPSRNSQAPVNTRKT